MMFGCLVERTRTLGLNLGAGVLMPSSYESLKEQWNIAGWGPHTSCLAFTALKVRLKLERGLRGTLLIALYIYIYYFIKRAQILPSKGQSLSETPFVLQETTWISLSGKILKAKTPVISVNRKEKQSRLTKKEKAKSLVGISSCFQS